MADLLEKDVLHPARWAPQQGHTLPNRSAVRARVSQKFLFHHEYWVSHIRLAWSLGFGYEVSHKVLNV